MKNLFLVSVLALGALGGQEISTKKPPDTVTLSAPTNCVLVDGKYMCGPAQAVPFDVPPTQDGISRQRSERNMADHYQCEDTSRFLLMSEDGKWHCLRLAALAGPQ